MASWGENIRAAREAKGWTRRQLAQAVDVPDVYVWRWETDQNAPTAAHMLRVAVAFGTDASVLFPVAPEPASDEVAL